MIVYMLACVGAVGLFDVLVMRGRIGVVLSGFLPWNR